MAQSAKLIGIGAAGNKAAIAAIEKGVIDPQKVLLLNSTLKDIPSKYKDYALEFGDVRGCGKERNLAKQMILQSLQSSQVNLESFMDPEDNFCIIVSSSEGGTGSGASSIIAEYLNDIGVVVHMFVFTGFEDDVRGLKNTVDWFSDLSEDYVVEAVSNKHFLDSCDGNRTKAEEAANEEFANRIGILLGNEICESETNIDDTDLKKLTQTPGYMTIETCHLTKLKDKDQFNALMQTMIDDSKSLETEQSAVRIGVVFNGTDKTKAAIDMGFEIIKKQYGIPIELYFHAQKTLDEEFINIIVSGMKLPIDDIKGAYDRYQKQMALVDKAKDSFFDRKFDTEETDAFNMAGKGKSGLDKDKLTAAKSSFFAKYGMNNPPQSGNKKEKDSKFSNTTKNEL